MFNNNMYKQITGTAMGTKFAPSYACLAIGFLEETELYPKLLPSHFNNYYCNLLKKSFLRYMDDGFIPWPKELNLETFGTILNQLHPSIKYTIEKGEENENKTQYLNFFDFKVILKNNIKIETDIYYKETNSHDYLNFNSHHPEHVKNSIPYSLAKRIKVFVSDELKMKKRLEELRSWLLNCNYSENLIEKCFYNALLQGPAPEKKEKQVIPLISTYYSNYNTCNVFQSTINQLNNAKDEQIKNAFKDTKFVQAYKQPLNLHRLILKTYLEDKNIVNNISGLFINECKDSRCKLCASYLIPCSSFTTSNGTKWLIKSHINCKSKNVIYYLKCLACNENTTYIGKTNNFRLRINNHISSSKSGNSSDRFDNHVFDCQRRNNLSSDPLFKVYAFMKLDNPNKLLHYESYLHSKGFDTMNR